MIVRTTLFVTALALLSGCTVLEANKTVEETKHTAIELKDLNLQQAGTAAIARSDKPRISGKEITLRARNVLPPVFSKQVAYATHGAQSLSEVLESIGSMYGFPIRGSDIVAADQQKPGAPALGMGQPGAGLNASKVQLDYHGTLRGLLDDLASRSEASWRYLSSSGTVEFFRYESRTMSIYLPAGAKSVQASISLSGVGAGGGGGDGSGGGGQGGGGGGGGSSGDGNVSVSQSLRIDPWTSILRDIQAILSEGTMNAASASGASRPSPTGGASSATGGAAGGAMSVTGSAGSASANPDLGLLTVTARPRTVERIETYVESINARFAQNVMIDLKIYSVTMDKESSLGFSMNALYTYLNNNGVNIVGAQPTQMGTGTPGQLTLHFDNPRSRLYGSSLIAQALNQIGNVALKTEGQVATVNGQPAPIQVVEEVNYLASSTITNTPNVGSTTALTPGTRKVGLTGNFLPVIIGDNRILLQYQLQMSTLTALTTVVSGNNQIQTPQIASQSLQQQAFVKDGEAIVLFGFDQDRATTNTAMGIGNLSTGARAQRQMLVVVMQVNGGRKHV